MLLRKLSIFLVVGLVLMPGLPAAADDPAADCPDLVHDEGGGWETIRQPQWESSVTSPVGKVFASKPSGIITYAIDPSDPARIFAATTQQVLRSTDGGCTWKKVFQVPSVQTAAGVDCGEEFTANTRDLADLGCMSIYTLDITPALADGPPKLYMQTYSENLFTTARNASLIWTSSDSGDTWEISPGQTENPSITVGTGTLLIAPSQPDTIYVERREYGGTRFFASTDAGQTWTKRSEFFPNSIGISEGSTHPGDVIVSTVNANELWHTNVRLTLDEVIAPNAKAGHGLFHSVDGGTSWKRISFPDDDGFIYSMAISTSPGRPPHIAAISASGGQEHVWLSSDGGDSWTQGPGGWDGNWGRQYLVFNKTGRYLFIAFSLPHDYDVLRVDLRKLIVVVLKAGKFDAEDGNAQGPMIMTAGSLYLLGGCFDASGERCSSFLRYDGRGA